MLLFRHTNTILELVNETRREITSAEVLSEALTIAAAETLAMALIGKAVTELLAEHPAVSFNLRSASALNAAAALRAGMADFGIFNLPAYLDGFDHLPLPMSNCWGILARTDGALAGKMLQRQHTLRGSISSSQARGS